jgi:hypothetical protein
MGFHHTFVRKQRLLKAVNASFTLATHRQHDRYFKFDFFNHNPYSSSPVPQQ